MRNNQLGIGAIERQRTTHHYLARQVAGLIEHIVHLRPIDGQQYGVCAVHGFRGAAGPGIVAGLARQSIQLVLSTGVAEDDLMACERQDRADLAAHQPRPQYADFHAESFSEAMSITKRYLTSLLSMRS